MLGFLQLKVLVNFIKNWFFSSIDDSAWYKNLSKEFRNISLQLSSNLSFEEWCDVYKKIIFWELELEKSNDNSIDDISLSFMMVVPLIFGKVLKDLTSSELLVNNNEILPLIFGFIFAFITSSYV